MKKFNTLLILALFCFSALGVQAQRYLEEVFDDVNIEEDVQYGLNYTIITVPVTGNSSPQPLVMDVYTPDGDTETARPLVLYFGTGNFLPNPDNGTTSGTKNDSINVEICTRLTKMGYVVANVRYRLGWNPLSTDINVRISTLINAAWRGVQDARSCVRFFRKTVSEDGNPYGICPDKITLFGEGTGGYITLGAATLDDYLDVVLPKFIGEDINGDGIPDPMVIEQINGDLNGETILGLNPLNGDTIALPNTPGYSSDVQLCVNVGGAIGDTSWIDESDPPMISFHVPTDPNAPYMEDILIVPTTGDQIVEVQGSYLVAQKANSLGLNDVFVNAGIMDDFTTAANNFNDGFEGLFPLNRPDGINPLNMEPAPEGSPWSWWDPNFWSMIPHPNCPSGVPLNLCNFHVIGSIGNNDMSPEKGRTYADSIIGYYAPRAYAALGLGAACVLNTNDVLDAADVNLQISPNPASSVVRFETAAEHQILNIQLYSISGQLIDSFKDINNNQFTMNRNGYGKGMYLARVQFSDGIVTEKIMFD